MWARSELTLVSNLLSPFFTPFLPFSQRHTRLPNYSSTAFYAISSFRRTSLVIYDMNYVYLRL